MRTKRQKMWGGRFAKRTDPLVEEFTSSIGIDFRLARYDVIGSIAHAKMLGKCRIIPASDARRLVRGLERILSAIERGSLEPDPTAEDVHSQIESRLGALIGPVAGKLHTARSRNDQVALDLRLYCRDAIAQFVSLVEDLQRALVELGQRHREVIIPGYTHLQRAQPVLLAHHLLAYVEMLARDVERLHDCRTRANVLPLGSGALAGTSLPIDRQYVARLLGFASISQNSLDAVSDRDFAIELLGDLSIIAMHLSRLAEDLILWTTEEFGIAALDDAFATGSSLMPQKKNPDVLELIRGQAGLIYGSTSALLIVMKGLPLAYNRDLQWDKTALFEAVDGSQQALRILAALLRQLQIREDRAAQLLEADTLCATDLAEHLVRRGVPFRQAHGIVGRVVFTAERDGRQLRDFTLSQLRAFSPRFGNEARGLLSPQRSVELKTSVGGTNPGDVARALVQWRERLK